MEDQTFEGADDEVQVVQERTDEVRKRKTGGEKAEPVFDVAPVKATCKMCKLEVTTFV